MRQAFRQVLLGLIHLHWMGVFGMLRSSNIILDGLPPYRMKIVLDSRPNNRRPATAAGDMEDVACIICRMICGVTLGVGEKIPFHLRNWQFVSVEMRSALGMMTASVEKRITALSALHHGWFTHHEAADFGVNYFRLISNRDGMRAIRRNSALSVMKVDGRRRLECYKNILKWKKVAWAIIVIARLKRLLSAQVQDVCLLPPPPTLQVSSVPIDRCSSLDVHPSTSPPPSASTSNGDTRQRGGFRGFLWKAFSPLRRIRIRLPTCLHPGSDCE